MFIKVMRTKLGPDPRFHLVFLTLLIVQTSLSVGS